MVTFDQATFFLTTFVHDLWENLGPCIPFLHSIFSSPSNHVGTLIWSLSNCIKAQGTLLDLYGPQNWPLNGPSKANLWGPLVKKGRQGPFMAQTDHFFRYVSKQCINLNLQPSLKSIGHSVPEQSRISDWGWWLPPPPPAVIRVNNFCMGRHGKRAGTEIF